MNRLEFSKVACAALVAAFPSLAEGAGFQVNEHGAAGMGRAGAVVATIRDPSAVFHNPGAMTALSGTQFSLGANLIFPGGGYKGRGLSSTNATGEVQDAQIEPDPIPTPHLYFTQQITEDLVAGVAAYPHYGLGFTWENGDQWVGRTVMQELNLTTFYVTPSVAYKFNEHISAGVGLNLVPASLYIRRTLGSADNGQLLFSLDNYDSEGSVEISASAFGFGGVAGVQLKYGGFSLGVAYKSAVRLSFNGEAKFHLPSDLPDSVRANFPDQGGNGEVTLPHTLAIGFGYERGPLSLEATTMLTTWNTYDELRIHFAAGVPQERSVAPRSWHNTWQHRIGGEYRLGALSLRAGGCYDVTPIPVDTLDPTFPGTSRVFGTLGAGYALGHFTIDAAYLGMYAMEREVRAEDNPKTFAPGLYGGVWIQIFSLTVSGHY